MTEWFVHYECDYTQFVVLLSQCWLYKPLASVVMIFCQENFAWEAELRDYSAYCFRRNCWNIFFIYTIHCHIIRAFDYFTNPWWKLISIVPSPVSRSSSRLFYLASSDGENIVRPLFFQFPRDTATYDISFQFVHTECLLRPPSSRWAALRSRSSKRTLRSPYPKIVVFHCDALGAIQSDRFHTRSASTWTPL